MFRVDVWGSLPQMSGQCSSSTVQIKTQELSREYEQMLKDLREEKDRDLQNLRVNKLLNREKKPNPFFRQNPLNHGKVGIIHSLKLLITFIKWRQD